VKAISTVGSQWVLGRDQNVDKHAYAAARDP
jgi:hypothetical protein